MKVIVAGTRTFSNKNLLFEVLADLDDLFEFDEIVSGKARGADTLGEAYAKKHDIPVKPFPANWEEYGRSAGSKRNELMAQYADVCVVFWDGESNGSRNMIKNAIKYGLHLVVIRYDKRM